jgi:hypothetical protein
MVDNGYLLYFRWWELLAELQKDSGRIRLAVLSNHNRHLQIWPRLWPVKQNSLISLYRLKWATFINNTEAQTNLHQPVIKISSVLSLHCSIRRMNLSTLTLGFAPSSPSSPYYQLHVQMRIRRSLQPSNSEALSFMVGSVSCYATCRSCRHLG